MFPQASDAQPPSSAFAASPVEVWGAFTLTGWSGSGQLVSAYEPELVGSDSEGRATQTVVLEPARGRGFEAGVNVFPWSSVGIQAFLAYARADVQGQGGPYNLELRYISRPPPTSEPQAVVFRSSLAWPDAQGRLEDWTFGGGPVVRWRRGRFGGTVSGGGVVHRRTGTAQSLGFTVFRLGGHSTLFSDEFRVRAALGPATTVGICVGTNIDLGMSNRVAATVGLRAFFMGGSELAARVAAMTDRSAGFPPPALVEIDRQMQLGSAPLPVSGVSLSVGIKVGRHQSRVRGTPDTVAVTVNRPVRSGMCWNVGLACASSHRARHQTSLLRFR
jgi:hypothetical protein